MEHSNVGHAQRRRMVSAFWSITCNDRIATDNCWCLRLELLRKDNDLKIEWNTDFKNITNTTQRMTPTTARYVVKSWWQGVLVTHTQMNRVILKSYYWKDVVQPFQGQPQRGRLQWCWETVWEKTISVLHERVPLQMHSYLQITSWCLKQRLVKEVNQWIWLRNKCCSCHKRDDTKYITTHRKVDHLSGAQKRRLTTALWKNTCDESRSPFRLKS